MMANQNQTRWDFLVFYISFPSSWFLVIINIYSSFDNKKNSSSLSLRTGENFWRGSPPLLFQMSERRCASRPNASDGLPAARVGQSFSSSFYSVFFFPLLPFQKERERLFPAAGWRRSKVSLSLSMENADTKELAPLWSRRAPLIFLKYGDAKMAASDYGAMTSWPTATVHARSARR